MSLLFSLCRSSHTISVVQLSSDIDGDQKANIGRKYRRGQRLEIAGGLLEIIIMKWIIIIWHSVCMSRKSIDLRRKNT